MSTNENKNENKIDAADAVKMMQRFGGYDMGAAEVELLRMRDRAREFVAKIDEFLAKRDENADAKVKLNELRFQLSRAGELASAARECKEHENKLDALANICLFDVAL